MPFRLISSNGGVTYSSYNAARTGDLAFAGDLIWTADQPGNGGPVNTLGMAFKTLKMTTAPGIRHNGSKVSNLANVAHIANAEMSILRAAPTTVEWLTIASDGALSVKDGAVAASLVQNCLVQGTTCWIEFIILDLAGTKTGTIRNCGFYDEAGFFAFAESTAPGGDIDLVINAAHLSGRSVTPFYPQTLSGGGLAVAKATLNAVNCVSFPGFGEARTGGPNEVCTCNTTNCMYPLGGRAIQDYVVTLGVDTNPIIGVAADEFISASDLYAPKIGAKRNGAGLHTDVLTDALGRPFTSPPNIGFAAPDSLSRNAVLALLQSR